VTGLLGAPLDLLAVFAHPDDEVLCAAGCLALGARTGQRVTVVCATRGELGPIASPELATHETLAQVRETELRASCRALGVSDVRFLDLPDAGVDWAAAAAGTLDALVRLICQERPRVIITFGPDGLYGHSDHVAIGALTTRARRLAAQAPTGHAPGLSPHVGARLFYPVLTAASVAQLLSAARAAGLPSALWGLGPQHFHVQASEVTARVDVSAVLDQKLAALRCHRTQLEADNVLTHLTPALASQFLASEWFRCADGRPGSPV
jgi:LmbE family N-acetylglucosaminyl deacetylase